MKIDGSGQRKTQRGVCSRAHGKWAGPIGYKLSSGEGGLLTGLWHSSPAHRYLSAIPAWRRGSSDRSSARQPCPQVLQSHPRVAKGRKLVPLTGLRSGLGPGLARLPCPQVLQWHSGVAKGASDRSSARRPCPQVPQSHPRVAKGSSGRSSARPAVSIFGERGDTLRPARTSAYSAPGNTSHRSGPRHIQWAPAYSASARRFSRARRRRGLNPRHIQ